MKTASRINGLTARKSHRALSTGCGGQEKEVSALLTGVSGIERNIIPLDIFNCGCLKEKYQEAFGGIKEVLEKEDSIGKRDWVGVMIQVKKLHSPSRFDSMDGA